MLFHHFFGFPEWLKEGVGFESLIPFDLLYNLAHFGKMCVAIFAFNTGYAMWVRQRDYTYSKIPKRIFKFLLQYWVVCLLFILYAFIAGDAVPTARQFAWNLFGFEVSDDVVNCRHAWYVYFYVAIMLLSPILVRLFQVKSVIVNLFLLMIFAIYTVYGRITTSLFDGNLEFVNHVSSSVYGYLSCVFAGVLVAKYNLFLVIDRFVGRRNVFLYLALIALTIFLRQYVHIFTYGFNVDTLLVVALIYSTLAILRNLKSRRLERTLSVFGKYSMNMWFIHALFHVGTLGFLQRVLYLPNYPILILTWGVVLVLPVAMFCSYLQGLILNLIFKPSSNKVS